MHFLSMPLQEHGDERGFLVAIEGEQDVPFAVRRVYYIYDVVEGARRGCHAHRALKQVLVCVHGSCRVLLDDGKEHVEVTLADPCESLYIGPGVWREMYDFSPDAVLMVLASEHYDEGDLISDYGEFVKYVASGEADV